MLTYKESSLVLPSEMRQDMASSDVTIELVNKDVWNEFHAVGNEMIITKNGRRMFPIVEVQVRGLEENSVYALEMEFVPVCDSRLRFHDGNWVPASGSEIHTRGVTYRHPESPNYGGHWMNYQVSFGKVKMTNKQDSKEFVVLNSHHKYCIQIHVLKLEGSEEVQRSERLIKTCDLPSTEFVAVTAYQNEEVTALKIKYNPFAKAFKTSKCKFESLLNADVKASFESKLNSIGPANRVVTPNGLLTPYSRTPSNTSTFQTTSRTSLHSGRFLHKQSGPSSLITEQNPLFASCSYDLKCSTSSGYYMPTHQYHLSWTPHSISGTAVPANCSHVGSIASPAIASTPYIPSTDYSSHFNRTLMSPSLPSVFKHEFQQDTMAQDSFNTVSNPQASWDISSFAHSKDSHTPGDYSLYPRDSLYTLGAAYRRAVGERFSSTSSDDSYGMGNNSWTNPDNQNSCSSSVTTGPTAYPNLYM